MNLETFDLTDVQRRALDLAFSDHAPGPWLVAHELTGDVDVDRLSAAVASLGQRTSIFGRSFVRSGGRWSMVVGGEITPRLEVVDLRGRSADAAYEVVLDLQSRSYRPEVAPLARFALLRLDESWMLVFTAASWLLDRFSFLALYRGLSEAYADPSLIGASLDLGQGELLEREHAFVDSPLYGESMRFWTSLLKDRRTALSPARWPDPMVATSWTLPMERESALTLLALQQEVGGTLPQLWHLCLHLLLARMTGSESIVTSSERRIGEFIMPSVEHPIAYHETVNFFVTQPRNDMRLRDYLLDSCRLMDYTFRYAQMPAEDIVDYMRRTDPNLPPFTNVCATIDYAPHDVLALQGVEARILPHLSLRTPSMPITVIGTQGPNPEVMVTVRDPLILPALRESFSGFTRGIAALYRDLDREIGALDWVSPEQRAVLIDLATKPETYDVPLSGQLLTTSPPPTLLQRIVQYAETTPDVVAVRFRGEDLTYRELLAAADALAERLRPALEHAGPDPLVGICLPRGRDMIVALVGILRAGAGYVPLDPGNPPERLTFILGDAKAAAIVVDDETIERVADAGDIPRVHVPDRESWQPFMGTPIQEVEEDCSATAYVIYTSGTTGLPKGVVVERGNLAAFLAATEIVCASGSEDRWMQFASINFDASMLEIGNCLGRGSTLVVVPADIRADPEAVADLLEHERITHAFIPPAMLRSLPRSAIPGLTDVYVGGEASDDLTVAFWSRAVRLWNSYGPTETTVMCSAQLMGEDRAAANLGGPLPGYSMYVLDEEMDLVPLGATGEIWIGGDAVTRGYLGREQLTAERFRPNPFGPGRIYRTGDLARYYPNGDLEYLGRNDFQVKIRGFRIELGDIDAAIAGLPGVTGAYVTVIDGPGGKSLGAWYTATAEGPDPVAVAEAIGKQLPLYMVPPHLVRMDAFPVNISGKVDRTKLPMPETESVASDSSLTPLEARVRAIWAEAIGVPESAIGADGHFFHLGGHSLAAATACHHIAETLGLAATSRLLFEHPTLSDFCAELDESDGAPIDPVVPIGTTSAPIPGAMPSMMFRRAAQVGSDTAYTIAMRVDVGPEINPVQFRRAVHDVLASDPVFRSSFAEESGKVILTVHEGTPIEVPLLFDADVDALVEDFRSMAFDLEHSPLWRAEVVSDEHGSTLLFSVHHGIFDGWSLNLFLQEIGARYDAQLADQEFTRDAPTMLDYGRWLADHEELRQRAVDYWTSKLVDGSCRTELPTATGKSRPDSNREVMMRVSPRATEDLKALSTALDTTMPPVIFAAYLVWLWRITGQRELIVAYPYAGRDVPGADAIFGMFVQMGFLRMTIDPDEAFGDLVKRVAHQMVEDREYLIASPYDVDLTNAGAPNILFSLQTGIGLEATYGSVTFAAHEYASRSSKADIAGILYDAADGGLEGRVEYDASALDAQAVPELIAAFEWLLPRVVNEVDVPVAALSYLPDSQRQALTRFESGPDVSEGPDTLVAALRSAALSHPDAIAIESAQRTLTYAEYDVLTDRLAARIRERFKPAEQQAIGLSGNKSPELVMGAIAILKAGCAYVPLDPHYPADRLRYILENAGITAVVADEGAAEILRGTGVADLDFLDPYEPLPADMTIDDLPAPDPRDLAYVIYTSGSTGRPKGVMIEHHTVPRMIRAASDMLDFDSHGRMLLLGTLNFDASVIQVFMPLLNGGTLVIPDVDAEKDPEGLHQFIDDRAVTHVVATPSLIRNLPHRPLPHIRMLGFGGEAIDAATAEYWCEEVPLWSLYGPTETTVMCSGGRILPGRNSRIIGTPLGGYTLSLRDELLQEVPLGAAGEIVIGGGGAARGYLGRSDLTLERFLPDPDGTDPFEVVYRSGDLGRFLQDGTIEYLGRNDDQIKLRGFRIELGEIEDAMQKSPGVSHAAAMVRGEGDLRMIVGYVTGPQDLDIESVRSHCATVLPDYMVPSTFVWLDELPLNANGKIDRKALPDVTFTSTSEPPHEGLERQIADVWEDLLHLQGIGRDDDFFRLGGNSLLAARLQTLLRERIGLDLTTAAIYAAPTIAGLAGQGEDDAIALAIKTAEAGVAVDGAVAPRVPIEGPPTVLLTGASGFLGIYLLADILPRAQRVLCLMRGADKDAARALLQQQADEASLVVDLARVDILLGDLSSPDLGLDPEERTRLADQVDVIVHNGAWVHHRYSYTTMRASNVDSTAALLRIALTGARRSAFTYVSTESSAEAIKDATAVAEEILDPGAHPPLSDNGYLLTKWVSEQLVADASRRYGLDALIARPGNITGDRRTGHSNFEHNHFWLFTKACLQLGAVPDTQAGVEMTPVDVLADAIAALALDGREGLRVANLSNPVSITWPEWLSLVSDRVGASVRTVTPADWQQMLFAADESNALWPLREMYAGDFDAAPLPVERDRTRADLHDAGIDTATTPSDLAPTYVGCLREAGFLPE